MAQGYALPYSGPGYPDFRQTGNEISAGLSGLVKMQREARASAAESAVAAGAEELRANRAADLRMNDMLLGNSAAATKDDLAAASQYVQLRQQELVLRDAHEMVAKADRAAIEARAQDAFLAGNPQVQALVAKLDSGTAWGALEGAVHLQRSGVLDRIPAKNAAAARKVLESAAANNLAHPVPGMGAVPLASIVAWGDPEFPATPLQRASYIATAKAMGGGDDLPRRFSAIELAAGEALAFTPDQHAELHEMEKLSAAADDLFSMSRDPNAPVEQREAAKAQYAVVAADLRARRRMFGPGYDVYRNLRAGDSPFDPATSAKLISQSLPPPTAGTTQALASVLLPTDPGSPDAVAMAQVAYAQARSETDALAEAVRTGDFSRVPTVMGRYMLGAAPVVAGATGKVLGNPASAVPQAVRAQTSALAAAANENIALAREAQEAGTSVSYRDLSVASFKRYWETGDLSKLTATVEEAPEHMNRLKALLERGDDGSTTAAPTRLAAYREELDAMERDLVEKNHFVLKDADGKYVLAADAAARASGAMEVSRKAALALPSWVVAASASERLHNILAAANSTSQQRVDALVSQLRPDTPRAHTGLAGDSWSVAPRFDKERPTFAQKIPGAKVGSPKLPSDFVPGIEYLAEYKVQGLQSRYVLDAADLVVALPTAEQPRGALGAMPRANDAPAKLAAALVAAASTYEGARTAFGGDKNPDSAHRAHFGTLFASLGAPAEQAKARLRWLFMDPSEEASYARGLVAKELGPEKEKRVREYLALEAPTGTAAGPAADAAASLAVTGYESLFPEAKKPAGRAEAPAGGPVQDFIF